MVVLFSHMRFKKNQEEVLATREHCYVQSTIEMEDRRVVTLTDNSNRVKAVTCFPDHIYKCSCMLFESIGIPCYHII
jgi:hypothetical protein